jgi:hypothetical protein
LFLAALLHPPGFLCANSRNEAYAKTASLINAACDRISVM